MSFSEDQRGSPVHSSMAAGVRAAGILEEACRKSLGGPSSLHLEVVRDLARDIGQQLDALSRRVEKNNTGQLRVDAALACADLATLAACNLPVMSPEEANRTVDAVHLAARAAHSLAGPSIEASSKGRSDYLMRDARGANWRADLASRQVDELRASEEGTS